VVGLSTAQTLREGAEEGDGYALTR
jgi:hypothetical protein